MIDMKKNILIGASFLAGAALIIYLGTSVVPKVLVTLSKASTVQTVSAMKTLLIGEKILAQADGQEECLVNVFVLDADGKGIQGKTVQLSGLGTYEAVTNELGKASFKLNTETAGQYDLEASVNGVNVGKTLRVTFR